MPKKKQKSNKRLFIIVGIILVAIAALGFAAKSQGWIGKPKARKVQFAKAQPTTIVEKVSASGKVQPVEEVKISSEVSGEIKELYIEEGDSVHLDTPLAKIRPDNLIAIVERTEATLNTQKANYAQAKALLAQSKARFIQSELDFKRNKDLHAQKVISDQEFETINANYEAAKADLEAAEQSVEAARFTVLSAGASVDEARKNLALTEIYAPMEGIVTKLDVEKGERVVGTQQMAGTEMLRIANLNEMEVRVDVNENDIIRVAMGDTAIIEVDSYSYMGETFKGVVTAIANSANEAAGTADVVTEFEVKIRILNDSYKHLMEEGQASPFRPGMTASVDIITEQKSDVLSVPLASVTTRTGKEMNSDEDRRGMRPQNQSDQPKSDEEEKIKEVVFVHKEGKVEMTEVTTGISDFENIEILTGIEEGTEVVKGPFLQVSKLLKDGDTVESIDKEKRDDKKEDEEEE